MVALYHGYSPSRVLAPLDHPCLWAIDHPLADRCTPEADMAEIARRYSGVCGRRPAQAGSLVASLLSAGRSKGYDELARFVCW